MSKQTKDLEYFTERFDLVFGKIELTTCLPIKMWDKCYHFRISNCLNLFQIVKKVLKSTYISDFQPG